MNTNMTVTLVARIDQYRRSLQQATTQTNSAASNIGKATSRIGSSLAGAFAGTFSIAAITQFSKAVLNATAEYQKFNAVLGNTLGSSAIASLKMKEIADFAARTPFAVGELTGAFVKLANSGFKPTGDQMTKLGDLASSTGKSFDQLAEAILDAQSGEFERLKEFGVRAKDAGDSVIFTHKGVQTQVEKTSDAIRTYVTNLGGATGVSGSMAKIAETLGGQISNLGDTWDQMLLSVGSNTEGIFKQSIGFISAAIQEVTKFNRELEAISRYDLGSNVGAIFDTLAKFSAAGVSSGAIFNGTSRTKDARTILDTQDAVSSYVSKALQATKTTADFGKALADLKRDGDRALKGVKDPNIIKGIKDSYQLGVKAVLDARRNFLTEVTSTANFGKSKGEGKTVKGISDFLSELDLNLKKVGLQFGDTFDERNEARIKAYQTAIDGLAGVTGGKAVGAIKKLQAAQKELLQLEVIGAPRVPVNPGKKVGVQGNTGDFYKAFKPLDEARKNQLEAQKSFNEEFNTLITQGMGAGISDSFSAIGEAFANGGNVMAAFGSSLLSTFGSFLGKFGDLLIAYGIAAKAKAATDAALTIPFIGAIAGPAAVIAGVALKVAAGAIGALATGGNKSSAGAARIERKAFANGGITYGPVNALVGEYPGAKSNPEVIAPLNKLQSIMQGTIDRSIQKSLSAMKGYNIASKTPTMRTRDFDSEKLSNILSKNNEPVIIATETRLEGETIVIATGRANKRMNRTMG